MIAITFVVFYLLPAGDPALRFSNGHFTMIGLRQESGKPLLRAYSIASANYEEHLEFFSIKVQDGPLTSRLQHLKTGDPIVVSRKPTGTLVLRDLSADILDRAKTEVAFNSTWLLPLGAWAASKNRSLRGLLLFCALWGAAWFSSGVSFNAAVPDGPTNTLLYSRWSPPGACPRRTASIVLPPSMDFENDAVRKYVSSSSSVAAGANTRSSARSPPSTAPAIAPTPFVPSAPRPVAQGEPNTGSLRSMNRVTCTRSISAGSSGRTGASSGSGDS